MIKTKSALSDNQMVVRAIKDSFVKLSPNTLRIEAKRFVIFAHAIEVEDIVVVAIEVVPFRIAPLPVIVTISVEEANSLTTSPTLVVLAFTYAELFSLEIVDGSTIKIDPPIGALAEDW
jgi:hypothetical protein